ncbi:hypothetical protein CBER1_10080 [Cercospora berteroae]|uniref:Uncharacterized protein n=1 Tax=Cercospora berteroae TaxID=357750 RepID=A0A2S6C6J8_9PEZI|nr:hypothetical protein CBER1_10080 [Cercospora berteroae]
MASSQRQRRKQERRKVVQPLVRKWLLLQAKHHRLNLKCKRLKQHYCSSRDEYVRLGGYEKVRRELHKIVKKLDTRGQERETLQEETARVDELLDSMEKGKDATGAESEHEGCESAGEAQLREHTQGSAGRDPPPAKEQQEDLPPAYVEETPSVPNARHSRGSSRHRGTEAHIKAGRGSARHEQDDHSASVTLEGINDNDVQMSEESSGTAKRAHSRKRMAREARPRPFYVPASEEDE